MIRLQSGHVKIPITRTNKKNETSTKKTTDIFNPQVNSLGLIFISTFIDQIN